MNRPRRRSTWSPRFPPTRIRSWPAASPESSPRSTACIRAMPRTRRWSPTTPRRGWGRSSQRIGWRARANEPAPDAVLRADLIAALGGWGDPTVVAEAQRLYETGDPLATSGPLRTTILAVVARNIDPAGWDRLHAQARPSTIRWSAHSSTGCSAAAHDPALAQRALDLALTDEPGPTTSPNIIAAVAARASRPRLRFRPRPQGASGVAGRCLVALALPARPRRRLVRPGDDRQAPGLCGQTI